MQTSPANSSELRRALKVLGKVNGPSDDGYYRACCPVCSNESDDNPSLSFKLNGVGVIFNCFRGCQKEEIKASVDARTSGLSKNAGVARKALSIGEAVALTKPSTVAELCELKGFEQSYLAQLGVRDGKNAIEMGYRNKSGTEVLVRFRKGKKRWVIKGTKPIEYGLDKLDATAQELIVVEGESDCWTLWLHGFNAIGIPGATTTKVLRAETVRNVERLYLTKEPDDGGQKFIKGLRARLAGFRFAGSVYVVAMTKEIKDPNGLHVKDAKNFRREFAKLLAAADKIELTSADAQQAEDDADARQNLADVALAQRFATQHAGELKYCAALGGWFIWTGKFWQRDSDDQIMRHAIRTAKTLLDDAERETDADKHEAAVKYAASCQKRERLRAMIDIARHMLAISPDVFDTDNYALNCRNGTVDLRTGKLKPHDARDLITKLIPIDYDPSAIAPRWDKFLVELFPTDDERTVVPYFQRATGYSLTGDQREQALFFHVGIGANGKGIFNKAIRNAVGSYGSTGRPELVIKKLQQSQNDEDMATLRGSRLVQVTETPEKCELDEAKVKYLTDGGEVLKASMKYQSLVEFVPTHHIVIQTNHKPTIHGTDHAIWRRLKLVNFNVQFKDAREYKAEAKKNPNVRIKDTALLDKLRVQSQGILTWAIKGAVLWWNKGNPNLREPRVVTEAVSDYRTEQDKLGQFISDRCERDADTTTPASALYSAYRQWALDNGLKPWSDITLGEHLKNAGFESKRTAQERARKGIKLKPDANANQEQLLREMNSKGD